MMKLSKDDPKLTAYALGEIDDPRELAEMEKAIAQSSELQDAVRGIQQMGEILSDGLSKESVPVFTEFEKAKLEQSSREKDKVFTWRDRLTSWPFVLAVASAAVFALVLLPQAILLYQNEPVNGAIDEVAIEMSPVKGDDKVIADPKKETFQIASNQEPALEVRQAQKTQATLEEEVFELSPFEMSDKDLGYAAAETLAGTRLRSQLSEAPAPASITAMSRDFRQTAQYNTESYDMIEETGFRSPLVAPLSTFSIDVDTASYANVRRFLVGGQLPPKDAVRIEELINYFSYNDAPPDESLEEGGDPFAVHMAQTTAPWNKEHRLLRIALKGYEMPWDERPASNLVFLLDVSGSMSSPNKLPLVKKSLNMLVNRLDERDRVAVVVYAGASGLALPSTTANNRETISHALNNLQSGGSTNAGAGIQLAYKLARDNFIEDGNNRVILCTDGDFNVGVTNRGDLAATADAEAENGIRLTVLGFGMGNYKDGMLEKLSNKGKGSYAYVDSEVEARKVFLNDLTSNLFTIAKDVKVQVEFNPDKVQSYRLIGYENRRLKAEDFNNDKKKAGDIGPGHSLVALYELVPLDVPIDLPSVDDLRYQSKQRTDSRLDEVAMVKLRYKQPNEAVSKLISRAIDEDDMVEFALASADVRFSAAVAAFGLLLRDSITVGDIKFQQIEKIAAGAIGSDPGGFRSEFTDLIRRAHEIRQQSDHGPDTNVPG